MPTAPAICVESDLALRVSQPAFEAPSSNHGAGCPLMLTSGRRFYDDHMTPAEGLHVKRRMSGCPAFIGADSTTLSQNSKSSGASTMIVDPCSNQPSSSPLRTLTSQGKAVGPLLWALRVTSIKCS